MRFIGLFVLAILFPLYVYAAAININTADVELLDTLPGIGPSKATAIVEYRNQNGSFARVEDIQNVSGIGPSTYAGIEPFITVGDASTPNNSGTNTNNTASSTPTGTVAAATSTTGTAAASSGGGPPMYLPIPTLRIVAGGDRTVSSGADTAFNAFVYDGKGNKRDDAIVAWSFGDGMRKTGASVFHAYYDPGEYIAIVRALTADGGESEEEIIVTVKYAGIKIASISSRGITLVNNDSRNLDLSLWRLSAGGQEFKIPEDTEILAGRSVLLPSQVTKLLMTDSASLLYPSGEVADVYPKSSTLAVQLFSPNTSTNAMQEALISETSAKWVKPITSTIENSQSYVKAVNAPAAATELAAAGAALHPAPVTSIGTTTSTSSPSLLRSPWILGLLGIVVIASGAFILL